MTMAGNNADYMYTMDSHIGSSVEYFSLVNFLNVPESYSSTTDIVCHFTKAVAMSPGSSDYIGIFPVGWRSVKDYTCCQPVVVIDGSNDNQLSVTFPASSLPSNGEEFFHFCYVSSSDNRVRGVSQPFQFTADRPTDWELLDDVAAVKEQTAENVDEPRTIVQVDESSQVSVNDDQLQLDILRQQLEHKDAELESCKTQYAGSMTALEMSLNEIKQMNASKDTKMTELQAELDESRQQLEAQKAEFEKLKASHAAELTDLSSAHNMTKMQLANSNIQVVQLTDALHQYKLLEDEYRLRHGQQNIDTPVNTGVTQENVATDADDGAVGGDVTQHRDETLTRDQSLSIGLDGSAADRTCPICHMHFPMDMPLKLFSSHVEDHIVKVCPICTHEFDPEDSSYQDHVDSCLNSVPDSASPPSIFEPAEFM